MSLLDGALQRIFYGAFAGIFLNATLHRRTDVPDGQGGGTSTWVDELVKASLDLANERMRAAEGYTDQDVRILMLAYGASEPTSDDEITVKGQRWSIASVATDPATAAWEMRGRRAG